MGRARTGRRGCCGSPATDGGASACDEPGAETEEGGSRTHAQAAMQRLRRGRRRGLRPAVGPACVGSQSGGIEHAIQPATTPKTTQPAKPIAPALSMMLVTRRPCTARIRLHPMIDGVGTSSPYGMRPHLAAHANPIGWLAAGRCVASLNHSQSPNGCPNPFPQGLRPRTLTTYIAPLTGSLPWRKPHRSGDGRCGPGRAPSLPPAGASATGHIIGVTPASRGRSRTVSADQHRTPQPEQRPAGGALSQACGRCTRSIQSCFSSVPATAIKRSSETGSWPATTSMRARARAATWVTRSATSRITS